MQFMAALLGGTDNTLLNSAFALGIVLVLIVLGLWGLKVLTRAGGNVARGRNRRLSVVDTANVDGKRQVVIIRRDNVEHVIMTGGPQDLVIETGIAVVEPAPAPQRRAARPRQPAPAASPPPPPQRPTEIAVPIVPEGAVPREAVDRLRDLARPAPLRPRDPLRDSALLRPVPRGGSDIIPMGPELRVDNSAGHADDSAKTAPNGNGQARLGERGRFFRSVIRREPL
ncbi:MAG TPA: hypothetical protein VHZ56_00245 [Devosia sp.]|nr:hypothetical protein [Devosia sp.]